MVTTERRSAAGTRTTRQLLRMRDELLSGFQHELDGMAQTGGSRDSAETRPDMTPADDALLRALRALIAALETLGRPVLPLEVQP